MAADYYKTLGINKDASQEDIKKAFRKLAHLHHPDKHSGDEAKFKEINEAYQVLSNAEKRAQYDQFGQTFSGSGQQGGPHSGFSGFSSQGFDFNGSGFEDIFSNMFGDFSGHRSRSRAGSDIQVDLEISFEEMVSGTKKEVRLRKLSSCETCQGTGGKPGSKKETCSRCHGSGQVRRTIESIFGTFAQASVCEHCHGRGMMYTEQCQTCSGSGRTQREEAISVDLPAGIQDEQTLSVSGKGAAGEAGAPAGDLFITVHVRPHASFVRRGDDILSKISISFAQAALGDKVTIETVEESVTMKIPAGTQPGEVFRIRNKGVPQLGRYGRGDHLVTVVVQIPHKLSSEQKKIIETLRAIDR
jgi:molecular chaperone DnaJ